MDELKNTSISSVLSDVKSEHTRKETFKSNPTPVVEQSRSIVMVNLKALVDFPDDIIINTTVGTNMIVHEVTVNNADIGSVIGKKGINSAAIRRILHCYGLKHRIQVRMELVE